MKLIARTIVGCMAACLLLLPSVSEADAPVAGLATEYAHVDPQTGEVEKMAGEKFFCLNRPVDPTTFGVAHRTLPCGTKVMVVNIRNGKSVVATVIDRGPYWVVPRACSKTAQERFPGHECWKRGRTMVRIKDPEAWVYASVLDITGPVARKIGLRGKEPVLVYPMPKTKYYW
jgi:hypothetical protein